MDWIIGVAAAAFWVGVAVWFFRHIRSERHRTDRRRSGGFQVLGGAAPWDAYGSPVGQAAPLVPDGDIDSETR